jgi:hypothetical protein
MGKEKEMRVAKVGDQYICNADGLDEYGMLYTITTLFIDNADVIFEDGHTVNWCYKNGKYQEWYDDLIPTELTKALV